MSENLKWRRVRGREWKVKLAMEVMNRGSMKMEGDSDESEEEGQPKKTRKKFEFKNWKILEAGLSKWHGCLLYTSPSPRD